MSPFTYFTVEFENKNTAAAICDVPQDAESTAILEALQLPEFAGIVTTIVGAGSMSSEIIDATRQLFMLGLAPVAEEHRLLVVDGGTRVGGMLAMGDARHAIGGTFPLIGVCPMGVVRIPDDLDPSHSHFVLVNGNRFGDEANVLPGFLNATTKPGVVIIVNCRVDSAYMSTEFPLHAKWADVMIAIRHSGGLADALLDTHSGVYKLLPTNAIVKGVDLDKPEALAALLRQIFIQH